MKRFFAAVGIFVLAAAASTAPAEIDRAATAMSGLEARFTHSFTPKGFRNAQVESGSVIFGSLPQMRWTYERPEQKVFVFNGSTSWFYVPADRQVTTGTVDEQRKRELPFLVVGDPAARERNFVVREQQRGRSITTTLQPRDRTGLIRTVTFTTDAASHLIQSIQYTDRDGNTTSFAFSGYHRARIAADTFTFTPPAGTQVVRAN